MGCFFQLAQVLRSHFIQYQMQSIFRYIKCDTLFCAFVQGREKMSCDSGSTPQRGALGCSRVMEKGFLVGQLPALWFYFVILRELSRLFMMYVSECTKGRKPVV